MKPCGESPVEKEITKYILSAHAARIVQGLEVCLETTE